MTFRLAGTDGRVTVGATWIHQHKRQRWSGSSLPLTDCQSTPALSQVNQQRRAFKDFKKRMILKSILRKELELIFFPFLGHNSIWDPLRILETKH